MKSNASDRSALLTLHESDAVWKLALESTGDGVWDWHIQDGVEYFSERYLQIYGYEPDEIRDCPGFFDELTHPDDRAQMARDREAHFSGATPIYQNEHRVRRKDGQWTWVLSRGMVIRRDADGRPLRMVGTHTDITARKEAEQLIWWQAHHDALTGLPNRRLLQQHMEHAIERCRQHGQQVAVLFIDLDRFKEVNDSLGHDKGDILLQQAAQRIQASLRPDDIVARMGGDEFTVLLCDAPSRAAIETPLRALTRQLAQPFDLDDEQVVISASIGVSVFPQDGSDIRSLFKHADQALYTAKDAGGHGFRFYTHEMQAQAQRRWQLMGDLHNALKNNEFHLVFQPIVDLASGQVRKAEALLRWQHPEQGLISPAEFIPIAEACGLILDIGNWVFRQCLDTARQWRQELAPDVQISFNKSPVQFRGSAMYQQQWLARMAEAGLPPDALMIEITEGLLIEHDPAILEQIHDLRRAGIGISLDDFGTGYSSLSYLQRYPFDYVKIDRSFVAHLESDTNALALCRAIVTMAHALSMKVVAEGVETAAQRELLLQAGCDEGQGYLFAKPMPREAFEAYLASATVC